MDCTGLYLLLFRPKWMSSVLFSMDLSVGFFMTLQKCVVQIWGKLQIFWVHYLIIPNIRLTQTDVSSILFVGPDLSKKWWCCLSHLVILVSPFHSIFPYIRPVSLLTFSRPFCGVQLSPSGFKILKLIFVPVAGSVWFINASWTKMHGNMAKHKKEKLSLMLR